MAKSNIKIKPGKRGTFTSAARKRGMGVQEFANRVTNNSDAYSPSIIKKANFVKQSANRNKKQEGGEVTKKEYPDGIPLIRNKRTGHIGDTFASVIDSTDNDPRNTNFNRIFKMQDGTTRLVTPQEWGELTRSMQKRDPSKTIWNTGREIDPQYGGPADQKFFLGGTIGGAQAGMAIGGPYGAAVGGILGGASELIMANKQKKAEKKAKEQAERMQMESEVREDRLGSLDPSPEYAPMFAMGGMINPDEIAMQQSGGIPAEIEGGETLLTPDRQGFEAQGPSHAQGGIPIEAEEGTRVYSDRLKIPGTNETFADVHAKMLKKAAKYEKTLDDPKATKLAINTAKRMLSKIAGEEDELYNKQQEINFNRAGGAKPQEFAWGGPILAEGEYSTPEDKPQGFGGGFSNMLQGLGGAEGILGAAGTIAPMAYNIGQGLFGKTQTLNPRDYSNPRAGRALSRMGNRSIDVNPMLDRNRQSAQVARRNVQLGARSRGEMLGNYAPITAAESRGAADIRMQQQQIQNQYAGEMAGMEMQLGGQEAAMRFQTDDINQRARSARRNMLTTGLSQLGQYSQLAAQRRNLKNVDNTRLETLRYMFPDVWEKIEQTIGDR